MFYFPTAAELRYENLLKDILNKLNTARGSYCVDFIDVAMANNTVVNYLIEKGYTVKEIRYEYKDKVFGYYGRQIGDGSVYIRISFNGNMNHILGDFRNASQPIQF